METIPLTSTTNTLFCVREGREAYFLLKVNIISTGRTTGLLSMMVNRELKMVTLCLMKARFFGVAAITDTDIQELFSALLIVIMAQTLALLLMVLP